MIGKLDMRFYAGGALIKVADSAILIVDGIDKNCTVTKACMPTYYIFQAIDVEFCLLRKRLHDLTGVFYVCKTFLW